MTTNIYLDFDGVINVFGHDHLHLRTPEHPKEFTVNKKNPNPCSRHAHVIQHPLADGADGQNHGME